MSPRILKPKLEYPPNWSEFRWSPMAVLSFDASLRNTGWSLVTFLPGPGPTVLAHGTIATSPVTTRGFEDSLRRGVSIMEEVEEVVDLTVTRRIMINKVIHEMPKAMGRGLKSGSAEAPPISAMAVRAGIVAAAKRHEIGVPPIIMVQNQHMKKALLGYNDPKITKEQVRQAVWASGISQFRTNEHVADSIALALTHQVDLRDQRLLSEWRRLTGKEAKE